MNEPISANREYKDSVFRMLYTKPETVLPLYSIKEGVLADFLLSQRSEVIAMSIFEYDHEEELKSWEPWSAKKALSRDEARLFYCCSAFAVLYRNGLENEFLSKENTLF